MPVDFQLTDADKIRLRRQLHRAYLGFEGFDPDEYTMLTLTTPPEFDKRSLNRAFRIFKLRMQRMAMWGEYYAVREWNAKGTCEHIHCLVHVNGISEIEAKKAWRCSVNRVLGEAKRGYIHMHLQPCYNGNGVRGLASYLAKYLLKQRIDDRKDEGYLKRWGRGYWYSQDWIFPGWRVFTKIFWRVGEALNKQMRVDLKMLYRQIGRSLFKTRLTCRLIAIALKIRKLGWSITLGKELLSMGLRIDFWGV